jgi:hypothetical protein
MILSIVVGAYGEFPSDLLFQDGYFYDAVSIGNMSGRPNPYVKCTSNTDLTQGDTGVIQPLSQTF